MVEGYRPIRSPHIPHSRDEQGRLVVGPFATNVLDALRVNDQSTWGELVTVTAAPLMTAARRYLAGTDQDTKMQARDIAYSRYRNRLVTEHEAGKHDRYQRLGENPLGYLLVSVRNEARNEWRRRMKTPYELIFDGEDESGAPALDRIAHAEDETEHIGTSPELQAAIGALKPQFYETFVLYAQGMSTSEISQQLGIEEGTVSSRISRARAQLRATMDPDYANTSSRGRSLKHAGRTSHVRSATALCE